jgi:uncharacterized protein YbcC (UPF0753/DUF2309 family)
MVFTAHDELSHSIEKLRHLLPIQGPIEIFIHHNTLHSFEHLDFEVAVESAGRIYGARPYLSEERYRELFLQGTIAREDVEIELAPFLSSNSPFLTPNLSRSTLRRNLLYSGLRNEDEAISRWKQSEARLRLRPNLSPRTRLSLIQETRDWILGLHGAGLESLLSDLRSDGPTNPKISRAELSAFIHGSDKSRTNEKRADAITASILWHYASAIVRTLPVPTETPPTHHAQALAKICGIDLFDMVHPVLIQLCSTFTDQGVSYWPMPGREHGLLAATEALFCQRGIPAEPWVKRAEELFRKYRPASKPSREVLGAVLEELGVPLDQRTSFLIYGGLQLKGWAGFLSLLETKPQVARDRPVKASLEEFLVVQNILVLAAARELAQEHGINSTRLKDLQALAASAGHARAEEDARHRMTQIIFDVAQISQLSPKHLTSYGRELAVALLREVDEFPETVRQRIWHLAYERSYLRSVLVAFGNHTGEVGHRGEKKPPAPGKAQVMFCIDEREGNRSLRRNSWISWLLQFTACLSRDSPPTR